MISRLHGKLLKNTALLVALVFAFHALPLEAKREAEKRTNVSLALKIAGRAKNSGSLLKLLEALGAPGTEKLRKSLLEEGVDLSWPLPVAEFRGGAITFANLEQAITVHNPATAEVSLASQRWRYAPKQDVHWNFSKLRGMWEPYWRFKKKGPMSNVALASVASKYPWGALASLFLPSAAKAALGFAGDVLAKNNPDDDPAEKIREILSSLTAVTAMGYVADLLQRAGAKSTPPAQLGVLASLVVHEAKQKLNPNAVAFASELPCSADDRDIVDREFYQNRGDRKGRLLPDGLCDDEEDDRAAAEKAVREFADRVNKGEIELAFETPAQKKPSGDKNAAPDKNQNAI